ncbi:MAG: hypothetical protein RL148_2495 [Planctomycetota bacterium]
MKGPSTVDPLERAMRCWLGSHAPTHGAVLASCAAALHAARKEGNSCIALEELARQSGHQAAEILAALRGSKLCNDGSTPSVFVLDASQRLYFHRTWLAESGIAGTMARRIATPLDTDPALAGALVREQFKEAATRVDWQAIAVAAAVRNRFTVVTGGPGTGKTYTVARLIHVLRGLQQDLSFALAAPTGKAARRMKESLADAKVTDLPESLTLHSLLGFQGGKATFARNERNPVPHDLVVVDEASMADVELLHALVGALRPEARLVLVGDRDQLPSVDLGQVLADLCGMARPELGVGSALAGWCRTAGLQVEERTDGSAGDPMASAVVALRVTRRFDPDSGLGRTARAISERRPDTVEAVLQTTPADLRRVEPVALADELQRLLPRLKACVEPEDPALALAAHKALRVLCVQNEGPYSVTDLNQRIEKLLDVRGTSYHGRPVLVTRNDPDLGLNNGDQGVCIVSEGIARVHFASDSATPRSFLPEQLPEHRTAWAMTVHKAQGSEADEVLLVLPPDPKGPLESLLQAPLVYTGLTRARAKATVVATAEVLKKALSTWPDRRTGFADALRAALGS